MNNHLNILINFNLIKGFHGLFMIRLNALVKHLMLLMK